MTATLNNSMIEFQLVNEESAGDVAAVYHYELDPLADDDSDSLSVSAFNSTDDLQTAWMLVIMVSCKIAKLAPDSNDGTKKCTLQPISESDPEEYTPKQSAGVLLTVSRSVSNSDLSRK